MMEKCTGQVAVVADRVSKLVCCTQFVPVAGHKHCPNYAQCVISKVTMFCNPLVHVTVRKRYVRAAASLTLNSWFPKTDFNTINASLGMSTENFRLRDCSRQHIGQIRLQGYALCSG